MYLKVSVRSTQQDTLQIAQQVLPSLQPSIAQPVRLSSTMPSSLGTLPSSQPPSIALLARL